MITDERALVDGAKKFGYVFETRTPQNVEVMALERRERYEILNVIEFTSTRKRMSVIVRTPNGKIKIFCKGADSVIYERLALGPGASNQPDTFHDATLQHLEAFASEGLRTLCFAVAEIPEARYEVGRSAFSSSSHHSIYSFRDDSLKLFYLVSSELFVFEKHTRRFFSVAYDTIGSYQVSLCSYHSALYSNIIACISFYFDCSFLDRLSIEICMI